MLIIKVLIYLPDVEEKEKRRKKIYYIVYRGGSGLVHLIHTLYTLFTPRSYWEAGVGGLARNINGLGLWAWSIRDR